MNIILILQLAAALFFSIIIAAIASKDKDDVATVAAITFIVASIVIYLRRDDHKRREPRKATHLKDIYAWPRLMQYEFNIVGESYYQAAIAKLAKQQESKYNSDPNAKIEPFTAHLIPENDNQYDNKAVRVDISGLQVGYLSREDARSFRRRLGSKRLTGQITTCGALVTGGHEKNGEIMSYGIVLDIEPF